VIASGELFAVVSPRGRVTGWAGPATDAPAPEYRPERVVFRGCYDDVLDYLDENLLSDGLPVVPPTLDRVERMLSHTSRDPMEVIGTVGDEGIEATVWNTAVNGVMAGCRAHHLPVLLAIAEIMAEKRFRISDAGSTTGWEILVVLSGPDLADRGLNFDAGVMRIGRRANSSIGRFTRLWVRNIAGLVIPPGHTDQAGIGQGALEHRLDEVRIRLGEVALLDHVVVELLPHGLSLGRA
jgi:hypothetical protein